MLVVDSDAVPSFPVAFQRLQAVAGRDEKIRESMSAIKSDKPPKGDSCDIGELLNDVTVE